MSSKKSILLPLLALVLGGLGAALRMWQRSHYEDGLPAAGDPAAYLLLALCALAAAFFLFSAWGGKNLRAGGLFTVPSPFRAGLYLAAAGLLVLSAVFDLKGALDSTGTGQSFASVLLGGILALLCVPTAISLAFLGKDAKAGGGRSRNSLTVLCPVIYCWVWLIDAYRRHTHNPVLWDYVFLLLAIITLLLAAYGRSSFSFGDGKPRFTLFVSLCALYCTPLALIGHYGFASLCATVAMALYTLASLTGLLENAPMNDPVSENQTEVSEHE